MFHPFLIQSFVAGNTHDANKNGAMIKEIGTRARIELEKILEKKVFLELFVKVVKNWQKDDNFIKSLGLDVK